MDRDVLHVMFNAKANPEAVRAALREVMDSDDRAKSMAINWQAGSAVIYSDAPHDAYRALSRILARDPQGFPFSSARVAPLKP